MWAVQDVDYGISISLTCGVYPTWGWSDNDILVSSIIPRVIPPIQSRF